MKKAPPAVSSASSHIYSYLRHRNIYFISCQIIILILILIIRSLEFVSSLFSQPTMTFLNSFGGCLLQSLSLTLFVSSSLLISSFASTYLYMWLNYFSSWFNSLGYTCIERKYIAWLSDICMLQNILWLPFFVYIRFLNGCSSQSIHDNIALTT